MVQTPTKLISLEEFLQLPETKPACEYSDGEIVRKAMPQVQHSVIQSELSATINTTLKKTRSARVFIELRCIFGGNAIVPDISVFKRDRIPRDANGEVANVFLSPPDWIIEIFSPEESATKTVKKILRCLENGTQMGWLIDPSDRAVFVYFPAQKPECFDERDRRLPVPAFASQLQLTVGELFDWLAE